MSSGYTFATDHTKQGYIQKVLRERIAGGALKPGDRLPTRIDLEEEFQVSRVTIQRVFDQLAQDGFVQANGRGGTLVVEHPPNLARFALVFISADSDQNRFSLALDREARRLSTPERTLVIHTDVNGLHPTQPQVRLLSELRARRLAGVIWASNPGALANGPLIQETSVPQVAIMPISLPRLPGVMPDMRAFMERAIDQLVAKGRRRLALLSVPGHANDHYRATLHARGLESRPYWVQALPPDQGLWARNLIHLLFNRDQRERPDGLIIADDNLVEEATGGLIAAGMRVPEDVELVAHCNFPWLTPSVVPAHRLGYDAREVLLRCLAILASRRADDPPGEPTAIAPIFEHERTAADMAVR